jgi:hypothetical protein
MGSPSGGQHGTGRHYEGSGAPVSLGHCPYLSGHEAWATAQNVVQAFRDAHYFFWDHSRIEWRFQYMEIRFTLEHTVIGAIIPGSPCGPAADFLLVHLVFSEWRADIFLARFRWLSGMGGLVLLGTLGQAPAMAVAAAGRGCARAVGADLWIFQMVCPIWMVGVGHQAHVSLDSESYTPASLLLHRRN